MHTKEGWEPRIYADFLGICDARERWGRTTTEDTEDTENGNDSNALDLGSFNLC